MTTTDDRPKVSVVVPCRDAAPYVSELLDSLHRQSLPPAEVIVIDDGSRDRSADVVEAWADAHRHFPVRLIRQPARGVAAALHYGWSISHGELLARADADDVVQPTWLADLVEALVTNPGAAYAYPVMRMFGDVEGRYPAAREFSAPVLVWQGNFVSSGSVMRRSDYRDTNGIKELPAWEDWDLWLSFLELGKVGVLVDEELYLWRRHGATRNRMRWGQRRMLRLRIWAKHPRLLIRYAPAAPRLLANRMRRPIRAQ
ncbi:MAG TPA: glycosyltransferase family A protein [Mycobacteriales bacterium]|nr:glycosyltransferase family A protein [Mycobacteriales bacterium]